MLGPTWLTERLASEHSQLLSGPSFSQVKSCPWAENPTAPSLFIRLNWALPGSHLLLHAVAKRWRKSKPTIAIRNAAKFQFSLPVICTCPSGASRHLPINGEDKAIPMNGEKPLYNCPPWMGAVFSLFLRGFVLGFAVAASPGPIFFLCLRRTLAQGRLTGLLSGLGVATADGFYAAIATFGVAALPLAFTAGPRPPAVVGAAALVLLGARILLERRQAAQAAASP